MYIQRSGVGSMFPCLIYVSISSTGNRIIYNGIFLILSKGYFKTLIVLQIYQKATKIWRPRQEIIFKTMILHIQLKYASLI